MRKALIGGALIAAGMIGLATAKPVHADPLPAMCYSSLDVAAQWIYTYRLDTDAEAQAARAAIETAREAWEKTMRAVSDRGELFDAYTQAWKSVDKTMNAATWCIENTPKFEGS
jgi:hypothetical protein